MKTLLIALIFTPVFLSAQEIKESFKDEFTGKSVIRTTWETVCASDGMSDVMRISKIDSNLYLDFRMMQNSRKYYTIARGSKLMLKFTDSTVLSLDNLETKMACTGCGAIGLMGSAALGVDLSFVIFTKDIFEQLKNKTVYKFRIYTSDGYLEHELNSRQQARITKLFSLVNF